MTDEGKAYRVMRWLDPLPDKASRLRRVRAELARLGDGAGGPRAARMDGMRVSGGGASDAVGDLVADLDERRRALESEAAALSEELLGAALAVKGAWRGNRGEADAAFAYVLARYVGGESAARAARAAGATKWEAMSFPRAVAPMIYDSAPGRFQADVDTGPFGYWEFARGETVYYPRGAV